MSKPIKVVVVSATGKTGTSITNALLASKTKFDIVALTRESSLNNDANTSFRDRGVNVVAFDDFSAKDALVKILTGVDVLISCIHWTRLNDQIHMVDAAKEAGVKRFVPCSFQTPAPGGVMKLYDTKREILDAVQRAYLPYTVIDVGWWYQQIVPPVPSGRTSHAVIDFLSKKIPGDGTVPIGLTDMNDVGLYVEKIISDPRTINKQVFAVSEVWTLNDAWDLLAELCGESIPKNYLPAKDLETAISESQAKLNQDSSDQNALITLLLSQYFYSWGVRGDNTPEAAEYLGFLNLKTLYPDLKGKPLKQFFKEVLDANPTVT